MTETSVEPQFPGFDFPPDYAQSIAKITSFWSALESNINMAIWHFAGVYPAIGACMTEQIFTLDTRLKALASLVRLRRGPRSLLNRINKFSNVVRKAQTIRNRVAHHTWHQGLESKEISQLEIGARGTLTYGFKPIPITSLQADQGTVRKAMAEAAAIREAAEAALPTLPEIPLEELQPTVLHSGGHH